MNRIASLVVFGLFSTGLAGAQTGSTPAPVWVNLKSGVYHCPGTEHYGTTSKGKYMPEAKAIDQGYHANGGRLCTPSAGGDTLPVLKPVAYAGPQLPKSELSECVVAAIQDGDTFTCKKLGSVRVIGIDAPEMNQPPFGSKAKATLYALMPIGGKVLLSNGVKRRDKYNRLLAYVWLGGKSVNWQMIRQGYAVSYRYGADTLFSRWFDKAESKAKADHLGLWPLGGFDCRPKDHRDKRC